MYTMILTLMDVCVQCGHVLQDLGIQQLPALECLVPPPGSLLLSNTRVNTSIRDSIYDMYVHIYVPLAMTSVTLFVASELRKRK